MMVGSKLASVNYGRGGHWVQGTGMRPLTQTKIEKAQVVKLLAVQHGAEGKLGRVIQVGSANAIDEVLQSWGY